MDMKIISDALTAVTAWLELIDKQGWRTGGIAGAAVIITLLVVAIILKKLANKDKKEERAPDQIVGDGAETPDEMEFEDITHIRPAQSGAGEQSVGKNAKSGKKMLFKNIRQEIK